MSDLLRLDRPLQFTVPGPPVPQERAARSGKNSYTPPKSAEYRQRIGLAANQAMNRFGLGGSWLPGTRGPFSVELHFYRERDAGDLDNFTKAVLDALSQANVWSNDKTVHRLVLEMTVDRENPRTQVRIMRRT